MRMIQKAVTIYILLHLVEDSLKELYLKSNIA